MSWGEKTENWRFLLEEREEEQRGNKSALLARKYGKRVRERREKN